MTNTDATAAADRVMRLMNSCSAGSNTEDFLVRALSDHPTLQQKFIGNIVLNAICIMAAKYHNGWYDGRNEAACKVCSELYATLKNSLNLDERSIENWIRLPTI